jgi:hypothetical protein
MIARTLEIALIVYIAADVVIGIVGGSIMG